MSGASGRILVAEDDGGVRVGLVANLELEGYEVTEAQDGARALELLAEREFDLVISDVVMPKANGVEVLRGLKARSVETPLVLISAFVSESLVNAAVEEGLYAMLYKPVGMQAVLRIVGRALSRRPVLLVDDALDYARTLAESLRARGMAVETAADGPSAVATAERLGGVDACILDLMLPPAGGVEVCRQLRQLDGTMDIIGITGSTDPNLVRGLAREGVSVCLKKPFDMSSLLFALVKARSNGHALRD
jgi:two-component system response regulator HydG